MTITLLAHKEHKLLEGCINCSKTLPYKTYWFVLLQSLDCLHDNSVIILFSAWTIRIIGIKWKGMNMSSLTSSHSLTRLLTKWASIEAIILRHIRNSSSRRQMCSKADCVYSYNMSFLHVRKLCKYTWRTSKSAWIWTHQYSWGMSIPSVSSDISEFNAGSR